MMSVQPGAATTSRTMAVKVLFYVLPVFSVFVMKVVTSPQPPCCCVHEKSPDMRMTISELKWSPALAPESEELRGG